MEMLLYTVIGVVLALLTAVFLWNNLTTPKYNSIGEYLRNEGIPPRPKNFCENSQKVGDGDVEVKNV